MLKVVTTHALTCVDTAMPLVSFCSMSSLLPDAFCVSLMRMLSSAQGQDTDSFASYVASLGIWKHITRLSAYALNQRAPSRTVSHAVICAAS